MPPNKLQCEVLRVLAAQRGPDSYNSRQRLESAAEADSKALTEAGFKLSWKTIKDGKREAEIEASGQTMPLEWVADSAFRFFPARQDVLFGYVLHPVDLAANKASAAADRREPRDIVDLLTIHANILPLGAVLCAAVGRFPGQSPEEMLSGITRHSRFDAEEFRVLATEHPIDPSDLHRRIRGMLEDAEEFIRRIPSDAVGVVFLEGGKAVQPDTKALGRYQRRARAPRAACGRLPGKYPAPCWRD